MKIYSSKNSKGKKGKAVSSKFNSCLDFWNWVLKNIVHPTWIVWGKANSKVFSSPINADLLWGTELWILKLLPHVSLPLRVPCFFGAVSSPHFRFFLQVQPGYVLTKQEAIPRNRLLWHFNTGRFSIPPCPGTSSALAAEHSNFPNDRSKQCVLPPRPCAPLCNPASHCITCWCK